MNDKTKLMIGILIVILIIGAAILLVTLGNNNNNNQNTQNNNGEVATQNTVTEKYVDVASDGTKINKSNKLKEAKKLGDLEISNILLTSKNNESYLQATVKNTGTAKAGDDFITITILDEQGKELTTIQTYLSTVEAGEEITLSSKTSTDFANAYDFTVSK